MGRYGRGGKLAGLPGASGAPVGSEPGAGVGAQQTGASRCEQRAAGSGRGRQRGAGGDLPGRQGREAGVEPAGGTRQARRRAGVQRRGKAAALAPGGLRPGLQVDRHGVQGRQHCTATHRQRSDCVTATTQSEYSGALTITNLSSCLGPSTTETCALVTQRVCALCRCSSYSPVLTPPVMALGGVLASARCQCTGTCGRTVQDAGTAQLASLHTTAQACGLLSQHFQAYNRCSLQWPGLESRGLCSPVGL